MSLYRNIIFTFSCIFLISCSFNPFSHDNELTGSPIGLGAGAAAGVGTAAVLGASKPVIAAAGIGGAGIGYYVTTLRFASGGIMYAGGQVYTVGDYLTIQIPGNKLFEPGSSEFLPRAPAILDSAVTVLQRYPNHNIMVSGNTSGFRSDKYERQLSTRRAERVAGYLWTHGISEFKSNSNETRRLTYVGYGNYFPIANNIHIDSIQANNRIQITAYPSRRDLELDKDQTIFNNIGESEAASLGYKPNPPIGNSFKGDRLPEQSVTSVDDFKGSYIERPRTTSPQTPGRVRDFYPEKGNLKGEAWDSYNKTATESHTKRGGRSVKQGGYKGFANFKGE